MVPRWEHRHAGTPPNQPPTTFDLALKLKSVKAEGIAVPTFVLVVAGLVTS